MSKHLQRNLEKREHAFETGPPRPQYAGKKPFRSSDDVIQCTDEMCFNYATHEALMTDPNKFIAIAKKVPLCSKHSRKYVASGHVVAIAPYVEYTQFKSASDKWEKKRASDLNMQGTFL